MEKHGIRSAEFDETDAASTASAFGDDWVHELISMTRPGVEIKLPLRGLRERALPFQYDDFS